MRDLEFGQMLRLSWAIFLDPVYERRLGDVFYFNRRESRGKQARQGERVEFRTAKPAVYLGGPVKVWGKPVYYDGEQVHLVWVRGHSLGLGRMAFVTYHALDEEAMRDVQR